MASSMGLECIAGLIRLLILAFLSKALSTGKENILDEMGKSLKAFGRTVNAMERDACGSRVKWLTESGPTTNL